MNVYKFDTEGETEYIAANTVIEAIAVSFDESGNVFDDLSKNDNIELFPVEKWEKVGVIWEEDIRDEAPYHTVKEAMSVLTHPQVICSTFYL